MLLVLNVGYCCGLQCQEVLISFRRNRKIGFKKIEGKVQSHTHHGRIIRQSFPFKEYRLNTVHGIKIGIQQKYKLINISIYYLDTLDKLYI